MKQALALGALFTGFALGLAWLHESAQAGAITTLRECFEFGFSWLNADGIAAVAKFIFLTVLIFFICEKLPKAPRILAALLLPALVAYVAATR
jgi:hypothetical protein